MRIVWKVSKKDVARVKAFYNAQKCGCFVQNRLRTIMRTANVPVAKARFWKALILCLLTTQQRSGPNSPVGRFVIRKPFPLSHRSCGASDDLEKHVVTVLKRHGGIRRAPTIARQSSDNYAAMEAGLWPATRSTLEHVRKEGGADAERTAANFIQDNFRGFGPKQSRNLLQTLGLSRYEIPIDSRITKWLNEFGFPVGLNATALADRDYYQFVSEGFQQLCAACDIWPCLLDAAIFSSFDGDAWNEENVYG